jgi:hypothetical protein
MGDDCGFGRELPRRPSTRPATLPISTPGTTAIMVAHPNKISPGKRPGLMQETGDCRDQRLGQGTP